MSKKKITKLQYYALVTVIERGKQKVNELEAYTRMAVDLLDIGPLEIEDLDCVFNSTRDVEDDIARMGFEMEEVIP